MNTTSFILDKIKQIQKSHDHSSMLCSVCQIPLTDPISQDAGKGPVCRTRTRFVEKLTREQLNQVEGAPELLEASKNVHRTVIMRIEGEEEPRFVTIAARDEGFVDFIDHSEYDKNYELGDSAADSILKAWYHLSTDHCLSIAPVVEPKDPSLVESLKHFHSSYREEIKAREKESQATGFRVQSKKLLDKKQQEERKGLIKTYRSDNNSKFKNKWIAGEFPMATLMARLSSSDIPGAQDLLDVLKSQFEGIEPKDHGLTDDEIIHGFQQATMPIEKKVFNAILKGKGDITEIAQVYKNIKESPSPEVFKRFNEIIN